MKNIGQRKFLEKYFFVSFALLFMQWASPSSVAFKIILETFVGLKEGSILMEEYLHAIPLILFISWLLFCMNENLVKPLGEGSTMAPIETFLNH